MSRKAITPTKNPTLPRSGTHPFKMLKRLAELQPGKWVAIDDFKPGMGNPCGAKETLIKKYGWHILEEDKAPDMEGRISKGHYRLADEYHPLARELMDAYYGRKAEEATHDDHQ